MPPPSISPDSASNQTNDSGSSTAPTTPTSPTTPTTRVTTTYTSNEVTYTTIIPTTSSSIASAGAGSNTPKQQSNGASNGVLAGVAVGAAVGAAIIAVIVTWMLLRSRNRSKGRLTGQKHPLMSSSERKDFTEVSVTEMTNRTANQGYRWEQHLPQPADDNSIRFNAKTLFHQIELHVENFYSDTSEHSNNIPQDVQLKMSHFDSHHLPAPVAVLMQQGRSTAAVIKHCLARYIVSSIDIAEARQSSFLSMEYTTLAAATQNRRMAKQAGAREAFSQWRVLTAYLRADSDTATAQRDAVIQDCATKFSTAFAPWAAPRQSNADRVQNLVEIMRSAAQFGDLLFSQGSDFEYVWDSASKRTSHNRSRSRNNGIVVICPGLVKVTDEKARSLQPVQVIVPPVTTEI